MSSPNYNSDLHNGNVKYECNYFSEEKYFIDLEQAINSLIILISVCHKKITFPYTHVRKSKFEKQNEEKAATVFAFN